jgi:hypothetical protein
MCRYFSGRGAARQIGLDTEQSYRVLPRIEAGCPGSAKFATFVSASASTCRMIDIAVDKIAHIRHCRPAQAEDRRQLLVVAGDQQLCSGGSRASRTPTAAVGASGGKNGFIVPSRFGPLLSNRSLPRS